MDALKIHLNPTLCGLKLKRQTLKAMSSLVKSSLNLTRLSSERVGNLCELVILAGGLYYMLNEVFNNLFNIEPRRCFIGARRYMKDDTWDCKIYYVNFEALPRQAYILIGDTIATGSTMVRVLQILRKHLIKEKVELKGIIIYSLAGAIDGILKISREIEEEYLDEWPEAEYTIISAEAFFGLEDNGTDMPYDHPNTVTTRNIKMKVYEKYTHYLARKMCCIFDWGDRNKNPEKHLLDLIAKCKKLLKEADEESKKILTHIIKEANKELDKLNRKLAEG